MRGRGACAAGGPGAGRRQRHRRRAPTAATISRASSRTRSTEIKIGITAANVIYLSHPLAKELSLGCASRNYSNELYAKADGRKPKPEFVDFVARAAALVFTLPKDEMQKGVARCLSQMGIFRGDDVKSRYRRLDMNCSRTKTEISIAISRRRDE